MEQRSEQKEGRVIGIKHRIKITAEREERPTLAAIKDGSGTVCHELATETDELDFLLARFPTSHREPTEGDDISKIPSHHLRWRKLKEDKDHKAFPDDFVQQMKGKWHVAQVPVTFDGLKKGDTGLMTFGGSGDRLAFALSRRGDDIGARVLRVPPNELKELRKQKAEVEAKAEVADKGGKSRERKDPKKNDHRLLLALFEAKPEVFFQVFPRDRRHINVAEAFRARMDAMKDRIACQQRLYQRLIGSIFMSEDGKYPEGAIEDIYDSRKANDELLNSLTEMERELENAFRRAVRRLDIWNELMRELEGFGERHAAGLVTAIVDIRRFMGENGPARLAKFCGVHVRQGGEYEDVPPEESFPRKRRGKPFEWNPVARQSLYLLADQWNYRPNTRWGEKLRENKVKFREKHPEPIQIRVKDPDRPGKTKLVWRYNDGHILNMARWRTMTQFIKWLYREWVEIEERHRAEEAVSGAAT